MDALALTDHGNMNGFSHQYFHAEKLKKSGVDFKAIHGVEAYFVPSLAKWRELYDAQRGTQGQAQKAAGALAPKGKGKRKTEEEEAIPEPLEAIGNEMAKTEEELQEVSEVKAAESLEDDSGGTIVENEEESKGARSKYRNPLYQRNHLVLLAKNDAGLKSLFRIVSDSAADGFYRYPRIDMDMLKKHANGNIIALSACIAGYTAKIVFDHQKESDHTLWVPNDDNLEEIQRELALAIAEFQEALGKENYYLEIQFNRLGAQHLVNRHLIEASKRTGCPLVVTCDAHYSDPAHWREREIYKMMGMLQFLKPEDGRKPLPEKIEELKCELYPKNAEQVWSSYKSYCHDYNFYDDEVVKEAIERTHDIAHQQIGSVQPDRKVKLPAIEKIIAQDELDRLHKELGEEASQDEDMVAFKEVKKLAIEGLKYRRVAHKQNYIDRLKYELEVIKTLKFAKYFLTYHHIMRVCGEQLLLGNARGSAGGSLLAYVLNITQMDPIKHDLLFERFMTRKKRSFPDIDCLSSNIKVLQATGAPKPLSEMKVGDMVLDLNNEPARVLAVQHRASTKNDVLWTVVVNVNGTYGSFIGNHKHRIFLEDGTEAQVGKLEVGDRIHSFGKMAIVVGLISLNSEVQLTDITVEGSASFQILPFNVMIETTSTHRHTLVGVNTYSIDADDYTQPSTTSFELKL